jgi:hypothetical protein
LLKKLKKKDITKGGPFTSIATTLGEQMQRLEEILKKKIKINWCSL